MLNRLEIDGLNGRISTSLRFLPDLNLITGRNGSGKTSILKLLWYILSGNLDVLVEDLSFERASLDTDSYSVSLSRREGSQPTYDLSYTFNRKSPFLWFKLPYPTGAIEFSASTNVEPDSPLWQIKFGLALSSPGSVFFPTFRRIEGGYSIGSKRPPSAAYLSFAPSLDQAMAQLTQRLSTPNHRFVSSISTQDLINLLTERFADISAKTNQQHRELSDDITRRIQRHASERGKTTQPSAEEVIAGIEAQVRATTQQRERLLRPFTTLNELIDDIFKDRTIQMTEAITLGHVGAAIASDKLSAGEKHMLSFMCYNAFALRSPIIIDEPELSLHVDWQRILFSTLARQSTDNQFVVATHSPFIYSKYPDHELQLNPDRGD